MKEKLYTVREAAEILNVTVESLRNYIFKGRINSRLVYNSRMLSESDIEEYKKSIEK